VHRRVLERGVRFTGCTVHFTTDEVDGGPIVDQAVVEVRPDDTVASLAERVQEAEREIYPRAIADLLSGRVRLLGGRVVR
jgi:phosphoribosylglycinamide formyltransferase-1